MDGTETPKGLSSEGQTSEGEAQGTSKTEAKSYTEEEVNKRISDALAAKGRDAKTLTDREASLKAEREVIEADKVKIADWQRQRDETELAEARRDPDKLAAWQKKQNDKTRDAEFATRETNLKKREAEHAEMVKAAQETQMEIKLWEIGVKYKVDPVILKDTMKDLNLTTVEQAEALAKRLTAGERPPEGEAEFIPISGVTSGTRGTLTPEQFEKLPIEEKKKYLKM
jgi:hypothetical protein